MKRKGKKSDANTVGTRQFGVVTLQAARNGMKANRSVAARRNDAPLGGVLGYIPARCRPRKSPKLKSKNNTGDQNAPIAPCELSIELVIAGNAQRLAINVNATASL